MDNNIVHRDLKPANVIYNCGTKSVRIVDFGQALSSDISEVPTTELVSFNYDGTLLYMAPEMHLNKSYNGS